MNTTEIADILLENESLHEQRVLVSEVSFYLKDLSVEITVRIYYAAYLTHVPYKYEFELSHYMYTPGQASPYTPSAPYSSSPEEALREAISALTTYYNIALKAGHSPSDDWLVHA
jgi:hypothetical protein